MFSSSAYLTELLFAVMHMHTCIHTCTNMHINMEHTYIHAHTNAHIKYMHTHAYTWIGEDMHVHTHTHAYTQTYTHTHTCIYTQTYAHVYTYHTEYIQHIQHKHAHACMHSLSCEKPGSHNSYTGIILHNK